VVSLAEHRQRQLRLLDERRDGGATRPDATRRLSAANIAHRVRMLVHLAGTAPASGTEL
jgi:hypothetical protein